MSAAPSGYGGLLIAGMALALPMAALREVVPCAGLQPLPSAAPGLAGAIALRGAQIPVVDLRRLLGAEPVAPACVVVLVHDGLLLGLAADAVTGIVAAEGLTLHPVKTEPGGVASLMQASFVRPDTGALVSLLDPAALFALPGVPRVVDPEPERAGMAGAAQLADEDTPTTHALMLLRCGRALLAIDALSVHATLDCPPPAPSPLARGACCGVVNHLGQRLPAVDLLALAGMGAAQPDAARPAFVIDHAPGRVAYLVDEVLDVVRLPREALAPAPALALPRPDLMIGTLDVAALPTDLAERCQRLGCTAQALVIDGRQLRADEVMRALAATLASDSAGQSGMAFVGDAATSARALLVYQVGSELATPLQQIAEILPFRPPASAVQHAPHLLGLQVHRGRTIALLCLSRLLGLPAPCADADTSVLVVEEGGQALGFVVPALRDIESARWEPALPRHAQAADAMTQAARTQCLAEIGEGPRRRMVRLIDLQALAAHLCATPANMLATHSY